MQSISQESNSSISQPELLTFPARHRQFVIESGIMPKREVHIFAAASGAGKTTLVIQLLDDLIDGNPVFEADTHPVNPVYICNDRSYDDFLRTLERITPRHPYPIYSMLTSPEMSSCQTPFDAIRKVKFLHPECDFIVYDPISFNVENINSAKEVSALLRKLTRIAQELNLTILIIHHTAKTKSDAMYASPRQRMSGCSAWGGYSNLNLIFEEEVEIDTTNPIRTMYVCPRNGANRTFRYIQDSDGCFVPAPKKEDDPKKERERVDKIFNSLPHGEITVPQLYESLGEKTNGSLYRAISRWQHQNLIEKVRRGVYLKVKNSSAGD